MSKNIILLWDNFLHISKYEFMMPFNGDTNMTTFQTATRYFLSETFVVVNVYWVKLYSVHHTVVWLVAWWNYDAAISFFSFLQMMLCSSPCFVFTSDKLIKDSFFCKWRCCCRWCCCRFCCYAFCTFSKFNVLCV